MPAIRASRKRLRAVKKKAAAANKETNAAADEVPVDGGDDDARTAREDEGTLLEMAMDWLSLHLGEADLRRGFRARRPPTSRNGGGA